MVMDNALSVLLVTQKAWPWPDTKRTVAGCANAESASNPANKRPGGQARCSKWQNKLGVTCAYVGVAHWRLVVQTWVGLCTYINAPTGNYCYFLAR